MTREEVVAIARRYNNVVTEMRMTLRVVKTVESTPGAAGNGR